LIEKINKKRIIYESKINGNHNTMTTNLNNKSNNKNTNNVFINLMVFAKDGIKNISPNDLAKILKSNKNIFENMITNVNLNPDKPEHHNLFYGDMKFYIITYVII
jgi:hypothetical protein